jgi:hypothetical protein
MASFSDLKNKLKGKIVSPSTPTSDVSSDNAPSNFFELEESRYLLSLIAKSDFSGKDVQMVYNIAYKLQKEIQTYLDNENG